MTELKQEASILSWGKNTLAKGLLAFTTTCLHPEAEPGLRSGILESEQADPRSTDLRRHGDGGVSSTGMLVGKLKLRSEIRSQSPTTP